MYDEINQVLEKKGNKDGIHNASYIGIEYMSQAAIILIGFFLLRQFSIYLAAAGSILGLILLSKRQIATIVLRENDMHIETLLFYMLFSLAACIIFMGWFSWI